jgi:hypothetical protein
MLNEILQGKRLEHYIPLVRCDPADQCAWLRENLPAGARWAPR